MKSDGLKKKHVALFVPSLRGGGAEKAMVTLANAFAKKGLKVDLLLAQVEGPYCKDILPEVRVVNLKSSRVLKSIHKLARYLATEKPGCLLSALNHANIAAIVASSVSGGSCKVIVAEQNSIFGSRSSSAREWLVMKLIGRVYRFADAVVAVSHGVAEDLIRTGVPEKLIHTIYNPVVSNQLLEDSKKPCGHPWLEGDSRPTILAVGRLEPQKDYVTLIRAFSLVQPKHKARLLILGEGSLRSELQTLVDALGLSEEVQLAGFVDNPHAYMSRAALFVMSSRWEGLPTVLIEALACGAAVVSTDCPSGPAEILEGGKWGSLVPVGNAHALADAISTALRHGRLKAGCHSERAMSFSSARAVTEYTRLLEIENA
jgi:glycosyltransferase involved in cell wall biosynthesis